MVGISPLGALGHLCQIAEKGWDQPFMSKDLRKILLGRKEKGKWLRFWVPEEVDESAMLKMCSGVRLWLGMSLRL